MTHVANQNKKIVITTHSTGNRNTVVWFTSSTAILSRYFWRSCKSFFCSDLAVITVVTRERNKGRIKAVQLEYAEAHACLSQAARKAPRSGALGSTLPRHLRVSFVFVLCPLMLRLCFCFSFSAAYEITTLSNAPRQQTNAGFRLAVARAAVVVQLLMGEVRFVSVKIACVFVCVFSIFSVRFPNVNRSLAYELFSFLFRAQLLLPAGRK
jgi:hypothetical protein